MNTKTLEEMQKQNIESRLATFPLCEYAWLPADKLPFSERVRHICRTECPQYGKSWSCPPAVGTVEACREFAYQYDEAFVFSTVAEVADIENLELTLATRRDHENVTALVTDLFQKVGYETFTLSTESCIRCEHCTYPDSPCRFPHLQYPCVESFGIIVVELAEKCGMTFMQGHNVVTWFSVILLRKQKKNL